ncbi:MAG TPA: hypothetical protein VF267_01060 [Gammaproteobacteria bacterium]
MRLFHLMSLLMVLAPVPAHAAEDCAFALTPGEAVRADYPGYYDYLEIFRPAALPGPEGYPVILWYHGYDSRLRPNTKIMRAVTGGEVFLLVGMDYGSERFYEDLEMIALDDEVRRFHDVLGKLERCVTIDRNRILLGGYSQGGYAITMIGERVVDEIAGMIVLGAGRSQGKHNLPAENGLAGKRIFVAAGADDHAHGENALATARLYAFLGAKVSMETWPETDHGEGWRWYQESPSRTAGLRQWLNEVLSYEPE